MINNSFLCWDGWWEPPNVVDYTGATTIFAIVVLL